MAESRCFMLDIPRALSGPGSLLLENVHAPMMKISKNYDRVSGYFGVKSFRNVIQKIESIWADGENRLIISPANMGILAKATQSIKKDIQSVTNLNSFPKREVAGCLRDKRLWRKSIQGLNRDSQWLPRGKCSDA